MKASAFMSRIHISSTWISFQKWPPRAVLSARTHGLMNEGYSVAVFSARLTERCRAAVMHEGGWPQILRREPSVFRLIPNAREAIVFVPHAQCETADHCGCQL